MQCHGALKGPLRRIIRSLGDDRVGSSCRTSPRRNLTGRATSSPPEQCNSLRDDRPPHSLDASFTPRPRDPPVLPGSAGKGLVPRSPPQASHSGPEQREETAARDHRRFDSRGQPELTSSRSKSTFCGSQNVSPCPAVSQGSTKASCEKADPDPKMTENPPNRLVIKRCMTDVPVKDGHTFTERYTRTFRKVSSMRTKNLFRAHRMLQERHNYPSSDDWRILLRMLDQNTPAGPELYKKTLETVTLPKGVFARFNGNPGASLKEIMEYTGCHVQIARTATYSSTSADAFAGLDLLGSSSQITHTLEILPQYLVVIFTEDITGQHPSSNLDGYVLERTAQADKEITTADHSAPDSDQQQYQTSVEEDSVERIEEELDRGKGRSAPVSTPIRSVWAENRFRKLSMYDMLDERPKSLKTSLEVSAYVADLCQRTPRALHRALHKSWSPLSQRNHVQNVVVKLVSLFSTPRIVTMATPYTIDLLIDFLAKNDNLAAFHEIYNKLEDEGYELTASNWNRCLAAAAKAGDVHNYRYTLKVMLRHEIKPDPTTWATLHELMCRRFPQDSSLVVDAMRDKGLLWNHSAATLVAQGSVASDLETHLASHGRLETFFRWYDNRFTSVYGLGSFNWLTVDVLNRMVAVLVPRGQMHDSFEVLREYRKRNGDRALDTVTLNTFLTSSLRDEDPQSAVAILQHFRIGEPGALVPDSITYTILFAIAWRRRYFNMLRVIWRYACASGQIGFNMRSRMLEILNSFLPKELADNPRSASRGHVWRAFAAKFAIGVSGTLPNCKDKGDAVAGNWPLNALETKLLHIVSLGSLPSDSHEFEERRKLLRDIMSDDSTEMGLSKPALPLADLLKAAWEKDLQWKERGLGLPRTYNQDTFREMLEDGIKVPMKEGDGTLETRAWEIPALLRRFRKVEVTTDVRREEERTDGK